MAPNDNDLEKLLAAAAAEETPAPPQRDDDIQTAVSLFDGWDTPLEEPDPADEDGEADDDAARRRMLRNRRVFLRRAVKLGAEIRHRQHTMSGHVVDVSRSGLMFRTSGEILDIDAGGWLTISFDHPHPRVVTQIERVAQVVRRDSYFDGSAWLHTYGIRFVDHLAREELTFEEAGEGDAVLRSDRLQSGNPPAEELAGALLRTVEAQMRRNPAMTYLAALVALEKTRDELRNRQAHHGR